jgi:type III pantothenate kinase
MNLTIDSGNTSSKLVIFDQDKIRQTFYLKKLILKDIKKIFSDFLIERSILSAVVKTDKNIPDFLRSNSFFISLNSSTRLPVKNRYKTPATLGSDRLASAIGANSLFPKTNVLVIDAGTCIKYDFINSKKEYLGGSISPGLNMRFLALHNFTDRLPLITPERTSKLTGATTKESILTGVETGIIHEMNGFIEAYRSRYKELNIVMSGGDAPLFVKRLKSSIFAAPNLIHVGLHEILKFNAEEA